MSSVFGGTVNAKHLVCTGTGDDGLDWTFGWTGKVQFVVAQQHDDAGERVLTAEEAAVRRLKRGVVEAQAERLAASIDLRRLHMARGIDAPVPTLESASQHRYSAEERAYVQSQRPRAVIGSPTTCHQQLTALAERYQADELMVLTITGDYASRLESYALLAEAFALNTSTQHAAQRLSA